MHDKAIRATAILIAAVSLIGMVLSVALIGPEKLLGAELGAKVEWAMGATIYDVLSLTPGPVALFLAVCVWLSMATNGLEHGLFYSKGDDDAKKLTYKMPWHNESKRVNLHHTDYPQEWAYYGLAFLAPISILFIAGAIFAGRILFQGPINYTTNGGWLREGNKQGVPAVLPSFFAGPSRLLQVLLGLFIMAAAWPYL